MNCIQTWSNFLELQVTGADEASELSLLTSLQSSLAMKGVSGKKLQPCLTTVEVHELHLLLNFI